MKKIVAAAKDAAALIGAAFYVPLHSSNGFEEQVAKRRENRKAEPAKPSGERRQLEDTPIFLGLPDFYQAA